MKLRTLNTGLHRARKNTVRTLVMGDEGAVTMLFAVMASLLFGALATGLDTMRYAMTQAHMQMALDVATLSAGADLSHYSSTTGNNLTQWQADARAYYNANVSGGMFNLYMPDSQFVATVTGTPATGQTINLSASGTILRLASAFFKTSSTNGNGSSGSGNGSGSNVTNVNASNSALRLPQTTLELALVMDNTGSMIQAASANSTDSKMDDLKNAANNLLTNLFAQSASNYYVGLVPFASTVNVKGALNPSGSWMNPSFAYNSNNMSMSNWAGCAVEPRDANGNLYPAVYAPNSQNKFTPYYYNLPPNGLTVRTWNKYGYLCYGSTSGQTTYTSLPLTVAKNGSGTLSSGQQWSGSAAQNWCSNYTYQSGTNVGVVYDQTYSSNNPGLALTQNSDCMSQPVTFLTNTQSTLQTAINNMTPGGSTIIPVGLLWGWRMLSSPWSTKLAGGNSGWISTNTSLPMPENTQGLQRVMIVLTDGENQIGAAGTIPNDLYFNGLSGVGTRNLSAPTVYRPDGSNLSLGLTDSSELYGNPVDTSSGNNAGYPDDVNTFQNAVCSAIKADGVTVYAITFGSSASSSTAETAMRNCASPGNYYHAPDGATLNAIFQQIANNIGELRLVQ
jgi:Flp pilus assembly protein TadG